MKNDHQPLDNSSRSQQRAKRRKTNIVLNSLIVVVLLLIVFVSFNIFFGKDEKASSTANDEKVESTIADKESDTESASAQKEDNDTEKADGNDREKNSAKTEDDKDTKINKNDDDKAKTEDEEKSQDEEDKVNLEDEEIVTEGGNDPDVKTTIVNPAWEPVGTTQTGDHPSGVYSGVDWDEMVQAITYATGIDQSNMTILFLGNNGVNKSVGNIKQKDSGQEYRVYIEWVDGEGWKPTVVEEIQ